MIDTIAFSFLGKSPVVSKPLVQKVLQKNMTTYERWNYQDGTLRISYTAQFNRTDVELSFPKYLFGDQLGNPLSLDTSFSLFLYWVRNFFGTTNIYIRRIDLAYNVDVGRDLAAAAMVKYQAVKPKRARFSKLVHTTKAYQHSVFYPSRARTTKIYNKGWEQADDTLKGVLRYEITYRTAYFRAKQPHDVRPFWGIHCDKIDLFALLVNFITYFDEYDSAAMAIMDTPDPLNFKGQQALLYELDRVGLLDQALANYRIDDSLVSRYKSKKLQVTDYERVFNYANKDFSMSDSQKKKLELFYLRFS